MVLRVSIVARRECGRQDDAGLTLVEIGIALAILAVGFLALLATFPVALSGIQTARQSSTAVFLAVQRLEEIKAFAVSPDPARGLTNLTPASFPAEPYDSIAGYARYRREVAILDSGGDPADSRAIQVTVFYRSSAGAAAPEAVVSLSTLIASR